MWTSIRTDRFIRELSWKTWELIAWSDRCPHLWVFLWNRCPMGRYLVPYLTLQIDLKITSKLEQKISQDISYVEDSRTMCQSCDVKNFKMSTVAPMGKDTQQRTHLPSILMRFLSDIEWRRWRLWNWPRTSSSSLIDDPANLSSILCLQVFLM